MIDHELKRLHIHIPKTAGTSLRAAIMPNAHETRHEVATAFPVESWEDYFTFTFVRNPYDRMVSAYAYHVKGRYRGVLNRSIPNLRNLTFREYLGTFVRRQQLTIFLPMVTYMTHERSSKPVDFVGRFECVHEDYARLSALLKTDAPIPHQLSSHHDHYSTFYDEEARQIIEQVYGADLEEFDYSFDRR